MSSSWLIAVWSPVFTRFLHAAVGEALKAPAGPDVPELQIGAVIRAAVAAGLHVEGVEFPGGTWRDVGTLDAYYQANMDLIAVEPVLKDPESIYK